MLRKKIQFNLLWSLFKDVFTNKKGWSLVQQTHFIINNVIQTNKKNHIIRDYGKIPELQCLVYLSRIIKM